MIIEDEGPKIFKLVKTNSALNLSEIVPPGVAPQRVLLLIKFKALRFNYYVIRFRSVLVQPNTA